MQKADCFCFRLNLYEKKNNTNTHTDTATESHACTHINIWYLEYSVKVIITFAISIGFDRIENFRLNWLSHTQEEITSKTKILFSILFSQSTSILLYYFYMSERNETKRNEQIECKYF